MSSRRFLPHRLPEPTQPRREGAVVLPEGRSVGWAEFGDPDGDAVLWFHGTPGGRRQVPPGIDEEATSRGFRIIGVERPGTGLSTPWPHERVVDWAADIAHVADSLGADRFAVAGLSGGGPYVLACAAELGERVTAAAVLGGIGPTSGAEACTGFTRILRHFEPALTLLRAPAGEALTFALRPVRPYADTALKVYSGLARKAEREALRTPAMTAMFLDDLCTVAEGGLRAPVGDMVLFARDWGFSIGSIRPPVRFWHGDADGIVPLSHSRELADRIPHAEVVVIPGGGHFAGFQRPAEVLGWMRDEWPAPARRRRKAATPANGSSARP